MDILVFSALAGVCGTGLGGIIASLLGRRSEKMTGGLLAFAAGVMLSVVCFGLVPEANEHVRIGIVVCGLIIGIFVIMIINKIVDAAITARNKTKSMPKSQGNASMLRSGILMLIAIGLHNIPEGVAIGAGGSHNMELGILLSVMIALHNIPEGMAIAAPLVAGGLNRGKVIFMTAMSGAPTFIGGLLGVWLGNISAVATSISLSAAGGAMLYVVFSELIPQAYELSEGRIATMVSLLGVLVGMAISA